MLIGRLQHLQRLGLADETQPGTWAIHADAEKTLRALGERGDIIRTVQRHAASRASWPCSSRGRWPNHPRPCGREGLADELRDRGYLVIDGVDGKAHYVALNARDELANYPSGAVVEVKGSADVRAADKNIAALASDGLYTDHHLAIRAGAGPNRTRPAKSSPPTSAGWRPCVGPALWSALPKGYGRCRTTWPSVAASTTRSAWAAWPWS